MNKMKVNLSTGHLDYPDISELHMLRFYNDFKEEVGAMEKLVIDYGHIFLL